MKKRLRIVILLTLVLIFLFPQSTGCAPKEVEQTNNSLKIAYFGTNSFVSGPLYEFKQQHPDVEVTTDFQPYTEEDPVGEAFFKRISAEVMSGSGPDVIILGTWGLNANKMMRSGAFEDLNGFIENDPEFDLTKYNANVLKAGQVDGKQYIMPLTYKLPLVLTTQELLDKTGFDISTADNYNTFLEECLKYKQANIPGAPKLAINMNINPYLADVVDYDTGEAKINTPENRETIRLNYEAVTSQRGVDGYGANSFSAPTLLQNKVLFVLSNVAACDLHITSYRALKNTATPVQIPLYNTKGELIAEVTNSMAINANSPNKQNAYEFLKLVMNDANYSYKGDIHISEEAVKEYLESMIGKEEKLGNLIQGGVEELETAAGLTQEEVDEYMGFLAEVDGAYIGEQDVTNAHSETIRPYYNGETADLDGCIQKFEDKLKIIASE